MQEVEHQPIQWPLFDQLPRTLHWSSPRGVENDVNEVPANFYRQVERFDAVGNLVWTRGEVWTDGEGESRRAFAVFDQAVISPDGMKSGVLIEMDNNAGAEEAPMGSLMVTITVLEQFKEGEPIPPGHRLIFHFDNLGSLRRGQHAENLPADGEEDEDGVIYIDESTPVRRVLAGIGLDVPQEMELAVADTLEALMRGVSVKPDEPMPDLLTLVRTRRLQDVAPQPLPQSPWKLKHDYRTGPPAGSDPMNN